MPAEERQKATDLSASVMLSAVLWRRGANPSIEQIMFCLSDAGAEVCGRAEIAMETRPLRVCPPEDV